MEVWGEERGRRGGRCGRMKRWKRGKFGIKVCDITLAVNRCDLLYSFLSQTPAAHCSSSVPLQNTDKGDNDRDT